MISCCSFCLFPAPGFRCCGCLFCKSCTRRKGASAGRLHNYMLRNELCIFGVTHRSGYESVAIFLCIKKNEMKFISSRFCLLSRFLPRLCLRICIAGMRNFGWAVLLFPFRISASIAPLSKILPCLYMPPHRGVLAV